MSGFGSNIAPRVESATTTQLPTTLADTSVVVADASGSSRTAPLFFVAPGQTNFLMPAGLADGPATVWVQRGGQQTSSGAVRVERVSPAIFTAQANGIWVAAAALERVSTAGVRSSQLSFSFTGGAYRANPFDLGPTGEIATLVLYGTGIRGAGGPANVRVTIDGEPMPVPFAGAHSQFSGLDQINVGPLPRKFAGAGEVPVVLETGGRASNPVMISFGPTTATPRRTTARTAFVGPRELCAPEAFAVARCVDTVIAADLDGDGRPDHRGIAFALILARPIAATACAGNGFRSIVAGPTGVGKTTLLAKIRQLLGAKAAAEPTAESGHLAVVGIEATPPESRSFSWRSHFKRLLMEMNDPLVDCKRRMPSADRTPQMMPAYPNDRGVTADYHYAVEQALRYRRPSAVLIDEAQHLFALASGRSLEDQFNVLEALANRCNTVHVLCGTYDLLRIRNLSGQVSRRSIDIPFPRYDVSKVADRRTFGKILQTFAKQMPLPDQLDLTRHWEYLYERSIGCVGILKDWLVKALSGAVRQSAATLSLKHLEKYALSVSQCDRLIEEATRGEAQFREDSDATCRLRLRLGFPERTRQPVAPATASADRPERPRPGLRYPKRDTVGEAQPNG